MQARKYICEVISIPDSRSLQDEVQKVIARHGADILLSPPPLITGSYEKGERKGTTFVQILWFLRESV